jgi:hypothetical protein
MIENQVLEVCTRISVLSKTTRVFGKLALKQFGIFYLTTSESGHNGIQPKIQ